ncbi:beta/gamma crystallin domain-containing protein [Streptomyces soliscabiei]|uniref:beta/gamma crystallin domain-containing protein n=1 Tax=Streptomyces soliscabiei TaxID=588897 RepID=UPI0029BDCBAA|nr:beta/gamma crystallin domain-containing protein [Streptomyces sp. NY05-11A]MDX2680421.1 beta/gamma crystallin domain-containing protein [Streptomyces sp. NY05-11A]
MNRRTKQVVLSALTTVMAAASLTIGTASQASAMNSVACGDRTDFLKVGYHWTHANEYFTMCYANAGEASAYTDWTGWFDTGNNRVQYLADGNWQPGTPVAKWTYYVWGNHPGGVRVDRWRIL